MVAVSSSSGGLSVVRVRAKRKKDRVNDQCLHILDVFHSLMTHHGSSQVRSDGLEVSEEWQAHDLEAWCVSFSKVEVSINSRMSHDVRIAFPRSHIY